MAETETGPSPLRSVHTASFPALLNDLRSSVAVTTYQAGRLVLLRACGDMLNTHFELLPMPMGLAAHGGQLAVGTKAQVRWYRNSPSAARRRAEGCDACFIPGLTHFTGNISIHEVAWAGNELWAVNTRFSCLCTFDVHHSFIPRWRPPFVSAYAPEDRCHLNGIGVRGSQVRYATCLGLTDEAGGWRENKARGGALVEVPSGAVIAAELCMPHSPRWHDGRLWVLNSGAGELAVVDERTGRLTTVAQLPGFTRGLDFAGPFAFIGLSQVRETAVFSGIPISQRQERVCGVWIVDTRTGRTVGFVRFEGEVQEIFAVHVLPGLRYPDIMNEAEELLESCIILPPGVMGEVTYRQAA